MDKKKEVEKNEKKTKRQLYIISIINFISISILFGLLFFNLKFKCANTKSIKDNGERSQCKHSGC